MVCRHKANDPECSSHWSHQYNVPVPATPDSSKFKIKDAKEVNGHLVLKVLYPNCSKCSYEGMKVMVFLKTTLLEAIKWEILDPHFGDPNRKRTETLSPSPVARFPASAEGWTDAIAYANGKTNK